jgi:hypothetical protein
MHIKIKKFFLKPSYLIFVNVVSSITWAIVSLSILILMNPVFYNYKNVQKFNKTIVSGS